MARGERLLAATAANPAADWTLADVETVCASFGIACKAPRRGSHHGLTHPALARIVTIPSRRPIKPVYIRQLVQMVEAIRP